MLLEIMIYFLTGILFSFGLIKLDEWKNINLKLEGIVFLVTILNFVVGLGLGMQGLVSVEYTAGAGIEQLTLEFKDKMLRGTYFVIQLVLSSITGALTAGLGVLCKEMVNEILKLISLFKKF